MAKSGKAEKREGLRDEVYLSPKFIAEVLDVSLRTVQHWLQTGKIKALKFHRLWRIPNQAFEDFLASSQYTPKRRPDGKKNKPSK